MNGFWRGGAALARAARKTGRWVTHGRMPDLPGDPVAAGWRIETPDCPICGQEVTDVRLDREYEWIYPVLEMWPGGPPVTATWLTPIRAVVTSSRTVLQCGHEWPPGQTFSVRYHPPSRGRRLLARVGR